MSELPLVINDAIRERKLLRRGERILVAVSGGLDSMVLLHLLAALSEKWRWKLVIAHFNHQLRGRSSNADERLVQRTARSLGWPCLCGHGGVRKEAATRGVSLEMAARELRHGFLAETARKLKCKHIALAHHADDQVELFLLRLMRGAGGEGLGGMKWISASPFHPELLLVRPLLGVRRKRLAGVAREQKMPFREDASNASTEILRNRIRHVLLPMLRRNFTAAVDATVLRTMELLRGEAEVVDGLAANWLKQAKPAFDKLPAAVQRRVLLLQLRKLKLPEEFELIESLRLHSNQFRNVDAELAVSRDGSGGVKVRRFVRDAFAAGTRIVELQGGAGQGQFAGLDYSWRIVSKGGGQPRRLPGLEQFDADRIGDAIVLRHWRGGDRFRPIGLRGSVKLQDWFTDLKISRQERRRLVIACNPSGEIFWVEGRRIGEIAKLQPATKRRLIWRWQRA